MNNSTEASNRRRYSIIVVDDGKDLREMQYLLSSQGFRVRPFSNPKTAFDRAVEAPPSMFILEADLEVGDGVQMCREIRKTSNLSLTPIIFVSRRDQEADKVVALEAGGDDYITKPFARREVLARISASLRRCYELRHPVVLRFDDVEINCEATTVKVKGAYAALTPSQFRLLDYLVRNPGRTFSRDHLLRMMRVRSKTVTPRLVDVIVKQIRDAIEPDRENPTGRYIRSVSGFGYSFQLPENATRVPVA